MTTQADITLATFNMNQTANTLAGNIDTLLNAIADQNNISKTKPLDPLLINQINVLKIQIGAYLTLIGSVAGSSAVG